MTLVYTYISHVEKLTCAWKNTCVRYGMLNTMNDIPPATPPEFRPVRPEHTELQTPTVRKKTGYGWPIVLMVWPPVVFVGVILLYATVSFLFSTFAIPSQGTDSLFGEQSAAQTGFNVLLFLVGAVTVLAGPISFISGLVLLIVRANERSRKK